MFTSEKMLRDALQETFMLNRCQGNVIDALNSELTKSEKGTWKRPACTTCSQWKEHGSAAEAEGGEKQREVAREFAVRPVGDHREPPPKNRDTDKHSPPTPYVKITKS